MNHQINIDEAIAIAKEYHLKKVKIMKTRKHFIRKYELLVRCIQTNLEFFIT